MHSFTSLTHLHTSLHQPPSLSCIPSHRSLTCTHHSISPRLRHAFLHITHLHTSLRRPPSPSCIPSHHSPAHITPSAPVSVMHSFTSLTCTHHSVSPRLRHAFLHITHLHTSLRQPPSLSCIPSRHSPAHITPSAPVSVMHSFTSLTCTHHSVGPRLRHAFLHITHLHTSLRRPPSPSCIPLHHSPAHITPSAPVSVMHSFTSLTCTHHSVSPRLCHAFLHVTHLHTSLRQPPSPSCIPLHHSPAHITPSAPVSVMHSFTSLR